MQINHHPYTMNFIAYTQISIQIRRLLYQVSAILASFFLFGSPILSSAQAATSEITFRQGMTDLPSGVIHSQSGEKYRLSDFKGTPLVINFWASWCAPCISELPELEILSTSLEEDNIQVMLVNLDRAGQKRACHYCVPNRSPLRYHYLIPKLHGRNIYKSEACLLRYLSQLTSGTIAII